MKTVRLTSYIRGEIKKSLITRRFHDEVTALITEQSSLAHNIYNTYYTESDRARMAALPEGWLPTTTDIRCTLGYDENSFSILPLNGICGVRNILEMTSHRPELVRLRCPHSDVRSCVAVFGQDHAFSVHHDKLNDRRRILTEAVAEAARAATVMLKSHVTIGALVQSWPGIEPFTRMHSQPRASLPAVPITNLNALFNLPEREETV